MPDQWKVACLALSALEQLRDSTVIAYLTNERVLPPKSIDDEDVIPLYECLRLVPDSPGRVDLLLSTGGGSVSAARKIGRVLRMFAEEVTVLVPSRARSAGTLLCLGADQIVMGPLGELGPLDPHLTATGDGHGGPLTISAAEIRTFPLMATNWFGVRPDHSDDARLLSLLCQRVFPTTLSSFYRAEQGLRQAADEMLQHQVPDACARALVIERLMTGYPSHDHAIMRPEAKELGLRVSEPPPDQEAALWTAWKECWRLLAHEPSTTVSGLVMSTGYVARFLQPAIDPKDVGAGFFGGAWAAEHPLLPAAAAGASGLAGRHDPDDRR